MYDNWVKNYTELRKQLEQAGAIAQKYLAAIGSKIGFSNSRTSLSNIINDINGLNVNFARVNPGELKDTLIEMSVDNWLVISGKKYPMTAEKYMKNLLAFYRSKKVNTVERWQQNLIQSEHIRGVGTVVPRLGLSAEIRDFWKEASLDRWQPTKDDEVECKWEKLTDMITKTAKALEIPMEPEFPLSGIVKSACNP